MKIDAECIDKRGTAATVLVDLDYVSDEDELKTWILEELNIWETKNSQCFDTWNFVVSNWDDIVKEMEDMYGTCD